MGWWGLDLIERELRGGSEWDNAGLSGWKESKGEEVNGIMGLDGKRAKERK